MKKGLYYFLVTVLAGLAAYYWWPEKRWPEGTTVDRLVALKSERKLLAFAGGQLIKTYRIALGRHPTGHKEYEGDKKTPEGLYNIFDKNPNSAFYKNLGISYPNDADRAHALALGKPPGGDIKIHGLRNGGGWIGKFHRWVDWTAGCIALTNREMEELYQHTPLGTEIEIRP